MISHRRQCGVGDRRVRDAGVDVEIEVLTLGSASRSSSLRSRFRASRPAASPSLVLLAVAEDVAQLQIGFSLAQLLIVCSWIGMLNLGFLFWPENPNWKPELFDFLIVGELVWMSIRMLSLFHAPSETPATQRQRWVIVQRSKLWWEGGRDS